MPSRIILGSEMVSAVNIAMMNLEEFLPESVINETYERKNVQDSKKF